MVFPASLDDMLVHHRVTPSIKFASIHFIHLGGERHYKSSVLPKNKTLYISQGSNQDYLIEISARYEASARTIVIKCTVMLFINEQEFCLL